MKRFLSSALVAALLLAVFAPVASAAKEWCTDDPPVTVWVYGEPVTINVFVSVPSDYRQLLPTVQVSGSVKDDRIFVTLVGPNAPFKAYARINSLGLRAGDPDEIHGPGETVEFRFRDVNPAGGERWSRK